MNDIEELLQQVGNAVEVILAEDEAGSSDHGAEEPNDPPDQEVEVEVDLEWENGNKIIDEGSAKKKQGRKGPVSFLENKLERQKTFSKRKSGLLKKAKALHRLTGAKVFIQVVNGRGKSNTFCSHEELRPKKVRHVKTQATISGCAHVFESPPRTRNTSDVLQTSTKQHRPCNGNQVPGPSTEIQGLPGKKSTPVNKPAPAAKATNKCCVCRVIFSGSTDKQLFLKILCHCPSVGTPGGTHVFASLLTSSKQASPP
ncbi:serum response factor-like [Asterias rubens]|uniref:serum response factor-like n=1 Tax=Asterias rubens TaxID=7604 RepID=UPI001455923A|nr:serum response factor-like [Asterias rubens]